MKNPANTIDTASEPVYDYGILHAIAPLEVEQ